MKLEILDVVVSSRDTEKDGVKTTRYSQEEVYIYTGSRFPLMIVIDIDSPAKAYPPGEYRLNPKCFSVTKYGRFEINPYAIELLPLAKPVLATPQLNK